MKWEDQSLTILSAPRLFFPLRMSGRPWRFSRRVSGRWTALRSAQSLEPVMISSKYGKLRTNLLASSWDWASMGLLSNGLGRSYPMAYRPGRPLPGAPCPDSLRFWPSSNHHELLRIRHTGPLFMDLRHATAGHKWSIRTARITRFTRSASYPSVAFLPGFGCLPTRFLLLLGSFSSGSGRRKVTERWADGTRRARRSPDGPPFSRTRSSRGSPSGDRR